MSCITHDCRCLLQMQGTDWDVYSDSIVELRLGLLLHILELYHCSFKKQLSRRSDYGFNFYMEVCQFVYCLQSRNRKIGSLPGLNDWEEYTDEQRIHEFESVAVADFLHNHSFGSVLRSRKDSVDRVFREQCVKFMDCLVDTILAQQPVTGQFSRGLYAFCPELLLEGDDYHMLDLFRKLVHVLESSGFVTALESTTTVEEYSTFVVDAWKRHEGGGSSVEDTSDVRQYLLSDHSFLSRKVLCRVFKLCCLVVLKPRSDFPVVDIASTTCQVPEWVVNTCVCGVQSSLSTADFKLGAFFTTFTMNEVRNSIDALRYFMSQADFDPWAGICSGGQAAFVERYTDLFNARMSRKRGGTSQQANVFDESSRGVCPGGSSAAVLSDSAASVVSAPPVPGSSGSSSLRQSKTPIHSSLASLLGRKKGVSKSGDQVEKKSKKGCKKSANKSGGSSSKKNWASLLNCLQTLL